MFRRSFRIGVRLGLLAAIAFALFKVAQGRKAASPLSGGSEWAGSARVPSGSRRPSGDTPLVEPDMLQGVSLKKADPDGDGAAAVATAISNGEGGAAGPEVSAFPVIPESPEPSRPDEAAVPAPKGPVRPAKRTATAAAKGATAAKKAAKAVKKAAAAKAWVDPKGSICPSSHPVKGKLSSGIYHLPGMLAYERTTPDRCYAGEDAAEADGLRKAKR